MSPNVPAVYDGLPARIEKCVAFLGLANCGCSEPWEWSAAERPRRTEPRAATAAKCKQSCYVTFGRTPLFFIGEANTV
jgi:hypothetical protein